jgi:hypothetical protein
VSSSRKKGERGAKRGEGVEDTSNRANKFFKINVLITREL